MIDQEKPIVGDGQRFSQREQAQPQHARANSAGRWNEGLRIVGKAEDLDETQDRSQRRQ